MKATNKVEIAEIVKSLIPDKKENAITSRQLMQLTGLSFRELKQVISYLRIDNKICSKETDGGGYWIAESDDDIRDFVAMIKRRRDGYNDTIALMENHIETIIEV